VVRLVVHLREGNFDVVSILPIVVLRGGCHTSGEVETVTPMHRVIAICCRLCVFPLSPNPLLQFSNGHMLRHTWTSKNISKALAARSELVGLHLERLASQPISEPSWDDLVGGIDLLHVTGDTANGIISAGRYRRNYPMNFCKLVARSLDRNDLRP
jgi:hypothetical protein